MMLREYMHDLYTLNALTCAHRGQVMLCVYPQSDSESLHAVKWHPQQPDLVAVASDTTVYLLNIADAARIFGGEPISQNELPRVGQMFSVPSVRFSCVLYDDQRLTSFPAHRCIRLRCATICDRDHLRRLYVDDVEHPRQAAMLVAQDPRR